ncbi:MBL fold metallo-hydrolase [Paenibacillus beijingensis]|uniref:Carbon-phosphorus lyase n=1 Tax=Paenibacillus beijingensis TaxID=1126833 RepID=A0A0D5NGB5_9BACL|nr:carbon-phosphorus lyase [Paenibacillus beijingensis]
MKIHFLGTAAAEGFPNAFCRCGACSRARQLGGKNIRSRTSVIIDDTIKFDYSPDSFMQALRDRVDYGALRHLLVTHTHTDHYNAFDLDSRKIGIAHGIDHPLHIYGNDAVMQRTRAAVGSHEGERFAFHLMRPFITAALGEDEIRVTPLPADHDRLETCLLYVVEKEGKSLLYGHDTGWLPDDTWAWLKGKRLDGAILDCTVGFTGNKRERNHMSIETIMEVQRVFREENILSDQGRIVVTHISHNSKLLHEDLTTIFEPAGITVAYDGMVLYL